MNEFMAALMHAECIPAQQVGAYSVLPGIHTPGCLFKEWGLAERIAS